MDQQTARQWKDALPPPADGSKLELTLITSYDGITGGAGYGARNEKEQEDSMIRVLRGFSWVNLLLLRSSEAYSSQVCSKPCCGGAYVQPNLLFFSQQLKSEILTLLTPFPRTTVSSTQVDSATRSTPSTSAWWSAFDASSSDIETTTRQRTSQGWLLLEVEASEGTFSLPTTPSSPETSSAVRNIRSQGWNINFGNILVHSQRKQGGKGCWSLRTVIL